MTRQSEEKFNLLDHRSKSGVAYLHPGGRVLSNYAIRQLQLGNNMYVLEIGCGTGATLADLAMQPGLHITGTDISAAMLSMAEKRIRYCSLRDKIRLLLIKPDGKLPFAGHSFDAVYAESVLAIVQEQVLPVLLSEIFRVLKPGGRMITIDAVWKKETDPGQIRQINQQCLHDFGLIQSLAQPQSVADWQKAFGQAGFASISTLQIYPGTITDVSEKIPNKKSHRFTRLKKLSLLLNPGLWYYQLKSAFLLKTKHRHDGDFLESYVFLLEKPKHASKPWI